METEKTCGTCKWCSKEGPNYYMCLNEDSENFGYEVFRDETCDIHTNKY